jgi:hypothetical protein
MARALPCLTDQPDGDVGILGACLTRWRSATGRERSVKFPASLEKLSTCCSGRDAGFRETGPRRGSRGPLSQCTAAAAVSGAARGTGKTSSAPAAHAHTSVTRMRMAVAPTAVAARIFASAPSRCCRSAHHGNSQASRAHERPRWVDCGPSVIVRKSAAVSGLPTVAPDFCGRVSNRSSGSGLGNPPRVERALPA